MWSEPHSPHRYFVFLPPLFTLIEKLAGPVLTSPNADPGYTSSWASYKKRTREDSSVDESEGAQKISYGELASVTIRKSTGATEGL